MAIVSLELNGFRNIKQIKLDFSQKANLIYGENAQGKTNLLEAIYYCSILKSFRTIHVEELIGKESQGCFLKLNWANKIDHQLEIELQNNKKQVLLDGKKITKTSQISGLITPFIFSNDQNFLFLNFPAVRRKFFDRYLSFIDPEFFNLIKEAKKISDQKMSLLKSDFNQKELATFNQLLAANIWKIAAKRANFVNLINSFFLIYQQQILNSDKKWNLLYRQQLRSGSILEYQEQLDNKLHNELKRKIVLYGSQYDRFDFVGDEMNISSGQAKALCYSLLLAMASIIKEQQNMLLVFLIDDILVDLDKKTATRLIEQIKSAETQLFISSTNDSLSSSLNDRLFNIIEGSIYTK